MEKQQIKSSLSKLRNYCELENFKGYDPYDSLNSFIPFSKINKNLPQYIIQIQKRNPINIRPLLGIKKGYNPKALGLLLKAYSTLYSINKTNEILKTCEFLYYKLMQLSSDGYSGTCWGYNFDWANPGNYLPRYTPSVVVTAFVIDGLIEYSKISKFKEIKKTVVSSCNYILNDLPLAKMSTGICFGYTHKSDGCCYNANMLASETLAKAYSFTNEIKYLEFASKAVDFVLSNQKNDGSWNYSINYKTGKERKQIDFHQGFILVSLDNYLKYTNSKNIEIQNAIKKGLEFYKKKQFFNNGQSLWRLPKKYPVEIHNQAQGIITFSLLKKYHPNYLNFAKKITHWTIQNMQNSTGFFYYRKYWHHTNKISFMRWSQAWMFLALVTLLKESNENIKI